MGATFAFILAQTGTTTTFTLQETVDVIGQAEVNETHYHFPLWLESCTPSAGFKLS